LSAQLDDDVSAAHGASAARHSLRMPPQPQVEGSILTISTRPSEDCSYADSDECERKQPMKEYRIDDLARAAGISVRNVRVYQDRGLLPPPRKEGRMGWYNDSHLSRLQLITRMLERGYTFATISELLMAARNGLRVDEVLENDDLRGPWGFFRNKAKITVAELRKIFGQDASALERGKELGALAGSGDDLSIVNPRLLEIAQILVDAGVPLSTVLENGQKVREDLRDVAQLFIRTVTDRFIADALQSENRVNIDERQLAELAELARRLRPLANRVVEVTFAEVMEIEVTRAIDRMAAMLNGAESTETQSQNNTAGPVSDASTDVSER
jgi:DNA-binding transcriptional MerR regulator